MGEAKRRQELGLPPRQKKIELNINYRLVFPSSKMHDYGYSNNKAYTIKNFLLRVTPLVNGSFVRDSNLNFDDQFNTSDDISMDVTIPLKYIFHTNCIHSQNIVGDRKSINFNCRKLKDLSFFIYKNNEFEMIKNIMDMVDHVLVMTVNPGFGGQAYIPTMLNKIREIRNFIIEKNLDVDIEVDGGIKANWTISQCADAGANCFIAGSGMFAYPTLKEGCDDLRKVAQEAQKGNVLSEPQ